MEGKGGGMLGAVVVAMIVAVGLLVFGGNVVEGSFSIKLDPCTVDRCIAECKKVLKEKFLSASCVTGNGGNFCNCLG
ncbi:hypothetical protein JCGZ_26416 [Jatropha curcas]|uniref:Uncharacterized protein n=1 Tax=Jatropha curcas TaxID=180498 RepID=A0A067JRG7_JATCU|nr:hypothetical protein JCGZ_26416 [Jatropha curcas]